MKGVIELLKQSRKDNLSIALALQDINVVVSEKMNGLIDFPAGHGRYRRDFQVFLELMIVIACLRQYDKTLLVDEYEYNGEMCKESYVECDCRDYEIAYWIFIQHMKSDPTFTEINDLKEITTPAQMQSKISAL